MKNEVEVHRGAMVQPVTRQDLEVMQAQRTLLKEFVASQLREASFNDSKADGFGEGDYGVIPGTKKNTLLKPGAEKLLQLFGLGVRMVQTDKVIDRDQNFAMFTYQAEAYHIRSGNVVAQCEGTANSQEVKYKERTVWRKKNVNGKQISESIKESTPIFDVLNTLMKMAQKRAMVGVTIQATGASDFFTADLEEQFQEKPKDEASRDVTPDEAGPAEAAPVCCGKEMMVSKFPNRETGNHDWYCLKCKSSKARGA